MNKVFLSIMMFVSLFCPVSFVCADEEVKASVAVSILQNQDIWAGQQVTVNLDLKTTGFSFSNSHFDLPEVDGAFLMQTDTTTVKLTESLNGETWQVIRYPLALYPQETGQLQIPSIGVRFSTSAGFGSKTMAFEFQTEPLEIIVKLPPGAKQGDMLVTTTSFELDYNWQPESGTSQPGDAVTLTVSRRAGDISAMLLPPLPVFETSGLAAYPQTPEVKDNTNRGDLTGERVDSIIWVIEQAGSYNIPGIRFQWWDPGNRELKQQIIPGISLDIPPVPADTTVEDAPGNFLQFGNIYVWILTIISILIVSVLLWSAYKRRSTGLTVETEGSTFATLQNACRSNKTTESHAALHTWIARLKPRGRTDSRPFTLGEFALLFGDSQLGAELLKLEDALISSNHSWQGKSLLEALQPVRNKIRQQHTSQSNVHLAPLNP